MPEQRMKSRHAVRNGLRALSRLLLWAVCAVVASPAVAADPAWKTLRIEDRADFTIDIPAKVTEESTNPAKGDYMAFFATSADSDMACFLIGIPYPEDKPQASFAEGLADGRGSIFCDDSDASVSDIA